MFCSKCGTKLNDGDMFCPKCGAKVGGEDAPVSDETSKPVSGNADNNKNTKKKNTGEKKGFRPGKAIIAVVVIVAVLAVVLVIGSSSDTESVDINEIIESVQDGYLGSYDTVSIKSVLDYVYGEDEWKGGISNSGEYYIVEFVNDYVDIQFTVYEGEDTFSVSALALPGVDETYTAYDVKTFMDALYSSYAGMYPDSGLYIDTSTSNNTLVGHYGPVKSVEESSQNASASDEMETADETASGEADETEGIASAGDTETPETEGNQEETVSIFDGMEPIEVVYGSYLYDNGEGYQMEAEVSFSSGEGYDYIIIDALSVYGGHYIADFYGTLDAPIGDGSYPAYDENYGTYIYVTFYEGGMNIWVSESSTDYDTYSLLGGDYTLTEALDLNNVG